LFAWKSLRKLDTLHKDKSPAYFTITSI
jgi:hypothetical protein